MRAGLLQTKVRGCHKDRGLAQGLCEGHWLRSEAWPSPKYKVDVPIMTRHLPAKLQAIWYSTDDAICLFRHQSEQLVVTGGHDTFFLEIADHARRATKATWHCSKRSLLAHQAHRQAMASLVMGWVSQQRPLGTVPSQGQGHGKAQAAYGDCRAGKGATKKAGKRATPPVFIGPDNVLRKTLVWTIRDLPTML